jgi:hypothetical protein
MNTLTDKNAFIVSNMGYDDDPRTGGWYVHDTFKASGVEILAMVAFSYDDDNCRLDFTINKERGYASQRTPSLKELKRLLDEALGKIPKHILDY